ncbi:hypothetical protein BDY21DRAFT_10764 [Lineolata rhizophorae]|uniref:Uncharacterized protein n=1 Tax=Lineolata rhizophorae TaxID=578093 RepID=A0A6A6PFY6_9PEZI|nr:hypothetical protein BDY21DRAFT_10764 [Lineolata rhizophorae]
MARSALTYSLYSVLRTLYPLIDFLVALGLGVRAVACAEPGCELPGLPSGKYAIGKTHLPEFTLRPLHPFSNQATHLPFDSSPVAARWHTLAYTSLDERANCRPLGRPCSLTSIRGTSGVGACYE